MSRDFVGDGRVDLQACVSEVMLRLSQERAVSGDEVNSEPEKAELLGSEGLRVDDVQFPHRAADPWGWRYDADGFSVWNAAVLVDGAWVEAGGTTTVALAAGETKFVYGRYDGEAGTFSLSSTETESDCDATKDELVAGSFRVKAFRVSRTGDVFAMERDWIHAGASEPGAVPYPVWDGTSLAWDLDGDEVADTDPVDLKGEKGDKGEPGVDGYPGADGEKGDPGDPGEPGLVPFPVWDGTSLSWDLDGDETADTDPVDLKGEKGDKGEPGVDGTNGVDGAKGDKGDPGVDGTNGVDGAKGDKGDPGDDATITPNSITFQGGKIEYDGSAHKLYQYDVKVSIAADGALSFTSYDSTNYTTDGGGHRHEITESVSHATQHPA